MKLFVLRLLKRYFTNFVNSNVASRSLLLTVSSSAFLFNTICDINPVDPELQELLQTIDHSNNERLSNWSGTIKSLQPHSVRWEPKTRKELIQIMKYCFKTKR